MEMYAIRDIKMGVYMTPVYCPNLITFQRQLLTTLKGGNGPVAEFPQDFEVYKIADFNPQTGKFENCEPSYRFSISSLLKGGQDAQETSSQASGDVPHERA